MSLEFVESISTILIAIIGLVLVGTIWWGARQLRTAKAGLSEIESLLRDQEADDVHGNLERIRRATEGSGAESVRVAWREFTETLVWDNQTTRVWSTVEAEQVFHERRFAPKLFGNRLLDAVPTILTTLGLVGTFAGLAFGLSEIKLDGDTAEMTRGIQKLVAGAKVGFYASLAGVIASLIANIVTKQFDLQVVKKARVVQDIVDRLFVVRSPEHSLSTIAASTETSAAALTELHEKIGDQFQASIGGAIQDLATSTKTQSAAVFQEVGDLLTGAFSDLSTRVAEELATASDTMRATIVYMGEQLAQQADQHARQMAELQAATARQVELLDERLPAIVESIDQASARLGTASEAMESSGAHLTTTATSFRATSDRFNDTLASSVETFDRLAARNDEVSSHLASLAAQMVELSESASAAARSLDRSAQTLDAGFSGMNDQQRAFLDDLDARLTQQSERMAGWLDDYSTAVTTQTTRRMDEWNEQTSRFTSTMVLAVQGLNSAVDELDSWMSQVRRDASDGHDADETQAA